MLGKNHWLSLIRNHRKFLSPSPPLETSPQSFVIHQIPCKWEELQLDLKYLLFSLLAKRLGTTITLPVQNPGSPIYRHHDLGQAIELPVPQFLYPSNGSNNINHSIGALLWGLNAIMYVKHFIVSGLINTWWELIISYCFYFFSSPLPTSFHKLSFNCIRHWNYQDV